MDAFISYSHRDAGALERLHVHLAVLRREGLIDAWFDRDILAGDNLDEEITERLETSGLFLLLVTPIHHGPEPAARPLRALSSALTAASHEIERLPGLRRGEDPSTRRGARSSSRAWPIVAISAVAASATAAAVIRRHRSLASAAA